MKKRPLLQSFKWAGWGLIFSLKTQRNIRIHFIILLLALFLGFILKINLIEWLVLLTISVIVISLELINTSVEGMVDTFIKEYHPNAKIVKDVSAAAVLVAAVGAVIIGLIIFLPKLFF